MATAQRTIDWYDANADEFAAHVRDPQESPYHAYYEKPAIRAELPDLKGKTVLVLGCGSGEDAAYLKETGAKTVTGIDIAKKLIAIAKQSYPECEFQVMDMEQLTLPNSYLDLVYSSLAVHYLIDGPAKCFKEVARVLKPGGIFLFSDGHPIGSAMATIQDDEKVYEKRLGIRKDKVASSEEDTGDYLTSRTISVKGEMGVDYWHQPISETINQLIAVGLVSDKMVEFKPTEGMKQVSPRHYERLSRIPEFLILRAHKPKLA